MTPNQELIYKGALRHATSENEKLRDNINGLLQQINELKIENDENIEVIGKLTDYLNQIKNDELDLSS